MRTATSLLLLLAGGALCAAQSVSSGSGWPDYGGNLAGQRFSDARQLQPGNVSALTPAWVFHTHDLDAPSKNPQQKASFEATPVLWNNTLYLDTPFNAIFALDAATGRLKWTFDPHVDRMKDIYNPAARGVALWHASKPSPGPCGRDVVLVATIDRRLIARDATTGVACKRFGQDGTVDLTQGVDVATKVFYQFTSPPTVVGDTIVLGSQVADNEEIFAASGAVRGFDAVTGRQKWSWEPIRDRAPHSTTVGSGNAWPPISADPEHDLVFVPTGSASVDFYGGTRLGDNRDADSLVALQASTGRKVWAFQLVHHDLWDYDTPSEPVLFTFRGNIPAVAVTTKTSMVYVFNRLTGEPLYPIVERRVAASSLPGEQAWPTQPFSTLPSLTPLRFTASDVHLKNPADQAFCDKELKGLDNFGVFTPPSRRGSVSYPGSIGGANWGSSALDPRSNVLFTRVSNLPFVVREIKRPHGSSLVDRVERKLFNELPEWAGGNPPPLQNEFRTPDSGGEIRDDVPQLGTPYALARQALMTSSGAICGPRPYGSIVALNLDTGQKLWSVPHGDGTAGSPGVGGVIVTASGLLFAASTNDPYLRAYDEVTGKELWRGTLPRSSNATPMTYSVGGRQYVVVAAGGHGFLGNGQGDEIVAFALPAAPVQRGLTHHKRNSAAYR